MIAMKREVAGFIVIRRGSLQPGFPWSECLGRPMKDLTGQPKDLTTSHCTVVGMRYCITMNRLPRAETTCAMD